MPCSFAKLPTLHTMPNLYDALTQMLREYWKAHDGAYPQAIELMPQDLQALRTSRKLINESMNFQLDEDGGGEFLGVPLREGQMNCLVAGDGQRLPVQLTDEEQPPAA